MDKPVDQETPGHAALRKGRFSREGQVYLVTFTTYRRRPWFFDFHQACTACREICDSRNWQSSALKAWVLMPDHWHGLVELGPDKTLSQTIQSLKANTARRIRKAHPGIGRIWAPSFHDRAIRSDEDLVHAARYLVLNPIRAGLSRRIRDYPFWDAVWV
ncbi:MAG TPA: transposase [Arenimonas sp.]|uniref:REP-associated tyrosine transposase n=1 Tax=Arenimonas sp. TaxID=1872635 RepID=UPI002CA1885A|nr:transposase [Arenimonas sp.]HMB58245.1 transposase [Arenimonas sp.]